MQVYTAPAADITAFDNLISEMMDEEMPSAA